MIATGDSSGDTALHAAACNGSLECLKEMGSLVTYNVLTCQNLQGFTALDLGRLNHHTDCVDFLKTLEKSFIEQNVQNYNLGGTTSVTLWQEDHGMVHHNYARPVTSVGGPREVPQRMAIWNSKLVDQIDVELIEFRHK